MSTRQEVDGFRKWHSKVVSSLRQCESLIRSGDVAKAQVCLLAATESPRPNVDLVEVARANSDHLLAGRFVDVDFPVDGMTAHAVVGQLAEWLAFEFRQFDHFEAAHVDPATLEAEMREVSHKLSGIDFDDLQGLLSRESARMTITETTTADDTEESATSLVAADRSNTAAENSFTLKERAIAALYSDPSLSMAGIAERINCSRQHMYKLEGFKAMFDAVKNIGCREPRRGAMVDGVTDSAVFDEHSDD